jgi:hypothetical protein
VAAPQPLPLPARADHRSEDQCDRHTTSASVFARTCNSSVARVCDAVADTLAFRAKRKPGSVGARFGLGRYSGFA